MFDVQHTLRHTRNHIHTLAEKIPCKWESNQTAPPVSTHHTLNVFHFLTTQKNSIRHCYLHWTNNKGNSLETISFLLHTTNHTNRHNKGLLPTAKHYHVVTHTLSKVINSVLSAHSCTQIYTYIWTRKPSTSCSKASLSSSSYVAVSARQCTHKNTYAKWKHTGVFTDAYSHWNKLT